MHKTRLLVNSCKPQTKYALWLMMSLWCHSLFATSISRRKSLKNGVVSLVYVYFANFTPTLACFWTSSQEGSCHTTGHFMLFYEKKNWRPFKFFEKKKKVIVLNALSHTGHFASDGFFQKSTFMSLKNLKFLFKSLLVELFEVNEVLQSIV